jgi:Calcium binding
MHAPSKAELSAMVEEATIDAYDEEEQLMGFANLIEENVAVPFDTTILGVKVTVTRIGQGPGGIVAHCTRGKHRQAISLLDLPLPEPPPAGAEWIAAYRHWAR